VPKFVLLQKLRPMYFFTRLQVTGFTIERRGYLSELLGFRTLSIVRYSKNEYSRSGNLIRFRPHVRMETPTLFGLLERANFSHWV
jgi:hypothetical protein